MEQGQSWQRRWDREVGERLVAGDEAALGELYEEFSPLVYGLAARVTRDWAAAEDITQEVFVRVWSTHRPSIPPVGAGGLAGGDDPSPGGGLGAALGGPQPPPR